MESNTRGSSPRDGNADTHGQTLPTPQTTAGNGLQTHEKQTAGQSEPACATTAGRGQQMYTAHNTVSGSASPPQSDSSSMTGSSRDKFDQESALKHDSSQVTENHGTMSCIPPVETIRYTDLGRNCPPLPGEQPPQHDVVEKGTGDGCSGNVDTTNDERAGLSQSHEEAFRIENVTELEPEGT